MSIAVFWDIVYLLGSLMDSIMAYSSLCHTMYQSTSYPSSSQLLHERFGNDLRPWFGYDHSWAGCDATTAFSELYFENNYKSVMKRNGLIKLYEIKKW